MIRSLPVLLAVALWGSSLSAQLPHPRDASKKKIPIVFRIANPPWRAELSFSPDSQPLFNGKPVSASIGLPAPEVFLVRSTQIDGRHLWVQLRSADKREIVLIMPRKTDASATTLFNALMAPASEAGLVQAAATERTMRTLFRGKTGTLLNEDEKLAGMTTALREPDGLATFDSEERDSVAILDLLSHRYVFNDLQVRSAERAARVVDGEMLPQLKRHWATMDRLSHFYGAIRITTVVAHRDFGNDQRPATTETITITIPRALARSFVEAKITAQEMLDQSRILQDGSLVKVLLGGGAK